TAFSGSVGSTSANALPAIFSYCPTPGQEYPPNVGLCDATVSMTTLVMRACAGAAGMRQIASASIAPQPKIGPVRVMSTSPEFSDWRDRYARAAHVVKTGCVSRNNRNPGPQPRSEMDFCSALGIVC